MWIIVTFGWIYFFVTSNYRLYLASATIFFYIGLQKFYHGSEMFISEIGLKDWSKRIGGAQPIHSNGISKTE